MKTKLIVVAGPTRCGRKQRLELNWPSVLMAKLFQDSQQVYRQLNIGTAKATPEEQAAALHHLIDVRDKLMRPIQLAIL